MAVTISLAITQNSQSVANNTSNVTVKVSAAWTYASWNGTGNASGTLTIDGVKYSFSGITFNTGKTTTGSEVIMTKTVNVEHDDDGTKTLTCSASFATGVSSGTVTASGSKVLTTIARATTPTLSASSVDMGGTVTISTPRASSSFTHDLAYSFAGSGYTTITTGVATSYPWTTPDLASKIPSATSGTVTIRCITKNGSTTVGTKTVTMTLKVPSTVVPTISAVTVTEATSGLAAQFGAYIQSKSKLSVVITAAGAKGSTIKSYKTTLQGSSYTAASFTTGLLTASGSLSMVTTVTDTRGRTAKKTTTVTVLAYTKPQILALAAYRYDAAGVAAEDGEYMGVEYAYSVPTLNGGNTAAMTLEYKQSTAADSAYATLLTGTALSADTTAMLTEPTFSTDYAYTVRLTVVDYFGAKASREWELPSGQVILDIGADGDCLGLFKTAERSGYVEIGSRLWSRYGDIIATPVELTDSQDLDTLLTPGHYIIGTTAISATIQNKPSWFANDTSTAYIRVAKGGSGVQIFQTFFSCSKVNQFVIQRVYYSGTWGDWAIIAGGTAWRTLTLTGDFEQYGDTTAPRYKVNGNVVTVSGTVKPTVAFSPATTGVKFASGIASTFCPARQCNYVCQGSGMNRWMLSINTDGTLAVSRYGTTDYIEVPVGAWLVFNVSYSL